MSRKVIYTEKLMRPIAHFSHASRIDNVIHVGASAGVFPDLKLAGESHGRVDMEAQTQRMFENLRTTLELLGGHQSDVVRIKAYVADTRDIAVYEKIYAQEFAGRYPAHCVIGSWDFPLPQAAVEIDTIAMIGSNSKMLPNAGLSRSTGGNIGGVVAGDYHYATAHPIDTDGAINAGTTSDQTMLALRNLSEMLHDAAFGLADICNLHVTICDMRDYQVVLAAFADFFDHIFPSWTIVGAPLARPEFRISIESIAVKGGGRPISTELLPMKARLPAPAMLAGDTLFLSGQTDVTAIDVEQQARVAWARLRALINAAGFDQDTVLRTNNVLTDWRDFAGFNRGYGPNVAEPYVPRATVLGQLFDPRAKVQIEGIAHRRGTEAEIVQVAPLVKR